MTPHLIQVNPAELRPNPWNSNIVSPENEAKLDASMKELGIFKPVLVREIANALGGTALEIIGGEHRAQSAVRLGMPQVPAFNLGPIDDVTAKKIGLADNARYGVDDTLSLAALIDSLGDQDLTSFLPYNEHDLAALSSAVSIDLDALGLGEKDDPPEAKSAAETKAPKTHTVIRFKVALGDSERISAIITKIQKAHSYTKADELTNAGDALVHLLLGETEADGGEEV